MKIKTAGDLRGFLADVLVQVRDGDIDANQASAIAKVSAQINNSLAVEVGAALQLAKMGKDGPQAGAMLLSSTSEGASIENGGGIWCSQCDMRVTSEQATACKSKYCKAKEVV